ncbi:hypothetical protein C2845_PM17G10460 [Panicum miliaceum]|uniref:RNase H type-1 domain-containing protein n=1 Tax=Panicum miliaceum TaxID=4540 RepID=A0A3L6Q254_PANMI|nr:hypothetical protein C2845_PM17G10460 [Panicum miliaceum]
MKEELQVKLAVLLWQWWNERNRVREGEKRRGAEDLVFVIEKNAVEFLKMGMEGTAKESNLKKQWRKPEHDTVKISSDGAYMAATGEGGWGYAIRNDGVVLYAGAGNLARLTDAMQAEVQACFEGAKAAAALGMGKVILETDSLEVVQAMKDNSYRLSRIGGDNFELKAFIVENFSSCVVAFVPPSCNRVAHALAALGPWLLTSGRQGGGGRAEHRTGGSGRTAGEGSFGVPWQAEARLAAQPRTHAAAHHTDPRSEYAGAEVRASVAAGRRALRNLHGRRADR